MNTYLQQNRLRLRRAQLHMDNFYRQVDRFINSVPYEMVAEEDSDGVNQFIRIKAKIRKELPLRLSIVAGDCIHNLRTILDNIIWQLGDLNGLPKGRLDKIGFPLRMSPDEFSKELESLKGLPQSVIDLIESLQPYQPYNGRDDPKLHPLYILNRLWNEDKHRSPVLVITLHKRTQIVTKARRVKLPDGTTQLQAFLGHHTVNVGGRLYDGKEIATFTVRPNDPYPEFDLRIFFEVAFDERGPAKGQPATKCLGDLHDFVQDKVLAKFEPIFPK